jgi:hypothetical protein
LLESGQIRKEVTIENKGKERRYHFMTIPGLEICDTGSLQTLDPPHQVLYFPLTVPNSLRLSQPINQWASLLPCGAFPHSAFSTSHCLKRGSTTLQVPSAGFCSTRSSAVRTLRLRWIPPVDLRRCLSMYSTGKELIGRFFRDGRKHSNLCDRESPNKGLKKRPLTFQEQAVGLGDSVPV